MQTLTVVNQCLATMGETSLNSLEDPHVFRGDAIAAIEAARKLILAKGWQFNTEYLTLSPSPTDSFIYLPGDFLSAVATDRWRRPDPRYTVRGRRLYDLEGGVYTFTSPVHITIIRDIPLEDMPEVPATYVAAEAVAQFQTDFDGDSTKGRLLLQKRDTAKSEAVKEDVRLRGVNMLDNIPALHRIRRGIYNTYRRG